MPQHEKPTPLPSRLYINEFEYEVVRRSCTYKVPAGIIEREDSLWKKQADFPMFCPLLKVTDPDTKFYHQMRIANELVLRYNLFTIYQRTIFGLCLIIIILLAILFSKNN